MDDDNEWKEEYGKDYGYFQANHNDLCSKHKNEFVVIKNLEVYHNANPLNLMELLKADGVDIDHKFIVFSEAIL